MLRQSAQHHDRRRRHAKVTRFETSEGLFRRDPQTLGHFLGSVEWILALGQSCKEKTGIEANRIMLRRNPMKKISQPADITVEPLRLQKTGKIYFASLQAFAFFRQSAGWVIVGR